MCAACVCVFVCVWVDLSRSDRRKETVQDRTGQEKGGSSRSCDKLVRRTYIRLVINNLAIVLGHLQTRQGQMQQLFLKGVLGRVEMENSGGVTMEWVGGWVENGKLWATALVLEDLCLGQTQAWRDLAGLRPAAG